MNTHGLTIVRANLAPSRPACYAQHAPANRASSADTAESKQFELLAQSIAGEQLAELDAGDRQVYRDFTPYVVCIDQASDLVQAAITRNKTNIIPPNNYGVVRPALARRRAGAELRRQ